MRKHIRLDRVIIKNLFGRLDYDIDLKNGYDVSILIAPNGCGKTTLFNIVSFMLHPTSTGFARIANIPYDECICYLSNGKIIRLIHEELGEKDDVNARLRMYSVGLLAGLGMVSSTLGAVANGAGMAFNQNSKKPKIKEGVNINDTVLYIENNKISINSLLNEAQKYKFSELSFDDEFDEEYVDLQMRYGEKYRTFDYVEQKITEFLRENNCDVGVNFIAADRLHIKIPTVNSRNHRRSRYDEVEQVIDPIYEAQKRTKRLYNDIKDEYNKCQSEAKDKLPKMYLQVDDSAPALTEEQFIDKWNNYVSDIEKYRDIGLLDSTDTVLNDKELKIAYQNKGAFLCVYLATFEEALKPLAREYKRLKLFVDILNERNHITKKVLSYGKDGLILTVAGEQLPLQCMSSGEKNDFIMFYNLIFNSSKNGVVLIDEPEISLHIEWQETFLDSLLKICEMNGLQAIVATHSPNIVNGHFELYANKGLTND